MEHWPVRYRLAAALVVPLLSVLALGAFLVAGQVRSAQAASRTQAAAQLTVRVNGLVRALAQERFTAALTAASHYSQGQSDLSASRAAVDRAYASLRAAVPGSPADPQLQAALTAAGAQMSRQLAMIRGGVNQKTATLSAIWDGYNGVVSAWLAVTGAQVGIGTTDQAVVRTATALAAVSHLSDEAGQQRGAVALTLFLRQGVADNAARLRVSVGAEGAWLAQFHATADRDQRALFDAQVTPARAPVLALREKVLAEAPGGFFDVNGVDWLSVTTTEIDRLWAVQERLTSGLADTSGTLAARATHRAWLVGLAAAAAMVLAVALSVVIARRLARQLRDLRADALEMAERRLPEVTAAIREHRVVDGAALPGAVADPGRDEIGDVTRALRDVYAAAVHSATEVAQQHSLAQSMRNLARRSQTLIHRLLKMITELERDQQDADMLDKLFRLDHLATRMRREIEGQIALSGGRPTRTFRAPVAVIDALRAAVAEVEDYQRVEVSAAIEDRLVGPVVGDMVHLLAELVENACQMSPDRAPVAVRASRVGAGVAIEVEDRGVGIAPAAIAEYNRRLADPPPFNPEAEGDKLGLWVVANLAARHQISVSLTRSPYGGVTAIAVLPAGVVAEADTAEMALSSADDKIMHALARLDAIDRLDLAVAGYDDTPAALPAPPSPAGPRRRAAVAERMPVRETGPLAVALPAVALPAPDPGADPRAVRDAFFAPPPSRQPATAGAPAGPGREPHPEPVTVAVDRAAQPAAPPGAVALPPGAGGAPLPPPPVAALPAAPQPRPARAAGGSRRAAAGAPPSDPPVGHLPRRRRGEHLSAELRAGTARPAPAPPRAAARRAPDPDRARSLVDAFRAGFQQGSHS